MEIEGESLDDILMSLYRILPSTGTPNVGSRGETLELLGVALRLQNARARLSRSENRGKSFSALGELLWYLSGRNDLSFIKEYVAAYEKDADHDGTIHGGYGPRLFAMRVGACSKARGHSVAGCLASCSSRLPNKTALKIMSAPASNNSLNS